MRAREWKPGDVALAPWPEHGADDEVVFSERRIVRFDGLSAGWARADDPDDYLLDRHEWSPTNTARPLVVIDPESTEDVERLRVTYNAQTRDHSVGFNPLQAALREFANPTPPKPEEPTGLGAVVEDRDGIRWVRSLRADVDFTTPWRDCNDDHFARHYDAINAVRVLSEGIQ